MNCDSAAILNVTEIGSDRWHRLIDLTVRGPDGEIRTSHEVRATNGNVTVLVYVKDRGEILLTRQFRPAMLLTEGIRNPVDEVPGGVIEPGRSPLQAAMQELEEELGVVLKPGGEWRLIDLGDKMFAPHLVVDSYFYIVVIDSSLITSRSTYGIPAEGELIRRHSMTVRQIRARMLAGNEVFQDLRTDYLVTRLLFLLEHDLI